MFCIDNGFEIPPCLASRSIPGFGMAWPHDGHEDRFERLWGPKERFGWTQMFAEVVSARTGFSTSALCIAAFRLATA
jgi:hypothetical protein